MASACLKDPNPLAHDASVSDGMMLDAFEEGWTDGRDEGPTLRISSVVDNGLIVAQTAGDTPGFEVELAPGGFPRRIGWGSNSELVSLRSGDSCSAENAIGIALYPNTKITEHGEAGPILTQYDSELMVRIQVPMDVPLEPNGAQTCVGAIEGNSTFTVFPDGRVHRHDQVETTIALGTDDACKPCATGSWRFTSFVVANIDGASDVVPPILMNEANTAQSIICAHHDGRSLAVGWNPDQGIMPQRYRLLPTPGNATQLAIVHDIVAGAVVPAERHHRDSHLLLGSTAGDCPALNERLEVLTGDNQPIEVAETGFRMFLGSDGIYDMGAEEVTSTEITLRPANGEVSGGFAVMLSFGEQSTDNLRMRHSGQTGTGWGRLRVLPDGDVIFFFRDPLLTGQSITIRL
jgi:hypothetical protein